MPRLISITGKALSGEWGTDDEFGNGIPVLRTTNFTNNGVVDYQDVVTRTIVKKNLEEKYLRKGDIIIEKSGGSDKQPVGRVIYFDGPESTYLFNNFTGLLRVQDTSKWLPKYVFYSLFANYSRGGTKQYENKTTGLHNLKTDKYISEFSVPDCSFEQQQHIAAVLDKVSELIDLRKRQLAKLDELVKAQFVEMFGDPASPSSKFDRQTFGNSFKVTSGGTPATDKSEYWENGTISWIGSNMCQDKIIYCNDGKFITEAGLNHSSAKIFESGTVLVALVGATIGKTALLRFSTATNQNVAAIDVNGNKAYNAEFVFYHLQFLYSKFQEIGSGKFKMANQSFIKNLPLICVPIELQNQFAAFVEQIDKQKLATQQSLDKLETLKKSLMQECFG